VQVTVSAGFQSHSFVNLRANVNWFSVRFADANFTTGESDLSSDIGKSRNLGKGKTNENQKYKLSHDVILSLPRKGNVQINQIQVRLC
jgi:hypothetical protein